MTSIGLILLALMYRLTLPFVLYSFAGWTGILCDKKYEICTNQKGHECYNGGECILGLEDKYGNEQLFCDCSKARGFVGKYCETPFVQRCGEDEVACVNGGACNPEYP